MVDRAAAAGYTGLALWDSSFNFMGNDWWPWENETRIGELLRYANSKHMRGLATPAYFGYSNEILEANPMLAEPERVVGTQFQVDASGKHLVLKNSFPGLRNPSFENGKTDWFDTGDRGIALGDCGTTGSHCGVVADAPGNGRFRQRFEVIPWRQYHLRLQWKAVHFRGSPMVNVLDASNFEKVRITVSPKFAGDHPWTQLDLTFNSRESTSCYLYFGVWGGSSGTLSFDDVQIEETAFIYNVRRYGSPVIAYDPKNPKIVYYEPTDLGPVADPRMFTSKTPFSDLYHAPYAVAVSKKSHLKPGQIVAIDSYSAAPVPGTYGVSMCMSSPDSYKLIETNTKAIKSVIPPQTGFLLGYDEIRQANSCGLCRSKHMDAGQLLAWSVGQMLSIYRSMAPEAPLYAWNDMFDPYQNAVANYYYVNGSFEGSWKALPAEVTIMNWNLGKLHDSLTWFSGLDAKQPIPHRQIIAGYYDQGIAAADAEQELASASGIPGVVGLMYTTWENKYADLESFAASARARWPAYLESLPETTFDYRSSSAPRN